MGFGLIVSDFVSLQASAANLDSESPPRLEKVRFQKTMSGVCKAFAKRLFRHGRVVIAARRLLFTKCRWSSCVTLRQSAQSASVHILMRSIRALNQDLRLCHPARSVFFFVLFRSGW